MSSRTVGSSFMSEVTSVLLLMTCEYLREVEQRRAWGGFDRGLCFEEVLRFSGRFSGSGIFRNVCWQKRGAALDLLCLNTDEGLTSSDSSRLLNVNHL